MPQPIAVAHISVSGIFFWNLFGHLIPVCREQTFSWRGWVAVQMPPKVPVFSKDVQRMAGFKDQLTLLFLKLTAASQLSSAERIHESMVYHFVHFVLRQRDQNQACWDPQWRSISLLNNVAPSWFVNLRNLHFQSDPNKIILICFSGLHADGHFSALSPLSS